jgi:hypothetical protein
MQMRIAPAPDADRRRSEGRQRPVCLPTSISGMRHNGANARRGVPNRGEHCQAAKLAAADIEGHSAGRRAQPTVMFAAGPKKFEGDGNR